MTPLDASVSSPSSLSSSSPSAAPNYNWWGGDHTVSLTLTAFDKKPYLELIRARGDTIRHVVDELKPALSLANALDTGCGVGFFTEALHECGLYVRGFDGRLENVIEARRRFPRIPFGQGNLEDPDIARLRARVAETLATAKRSVSDGAEQVKRHAKEVARVSDTYVRNQPWQAAGIAAAVGVLIGVLVARR